MKVYLASRYETQSEMLEIAKELNRGNIEVTSRWVKGLHDKENPIVCAMDDLRDIRDCNILVLMSNENLHGTGRGGRHVEFGYAFAKNKPIILVGERENVFHHLVQCVPSMSDVYKILEAERDYFDK